MKQFIIGLVGSGKTTLYRKLNETKTCNAVEIELPQSCIADEALKESIFKLFYTSNKIDCIITHPSFLPKNFFDLISKEDSIEFLDIKLDERIRRIRNRSADLGISSFIFTISYINNEELLLENLKKEISVWKKL